ncbi:outer membrane protein assembly factor BamD [Polyangium spumosum]|uniref:Outer membrane protein assembly factor BamD n=1 Tax=Polyangium spumosum TaxID=889282 RepID=A0A6N7PW20_9BACT|nr:outer membrane protein assembly factor BamD [Polyangium spumosum]MRG96258.1 outer membrane protein assembly factor BamD [Polyangium spumosum]
MMDPERLVDGDDLGAELLRSARALDATRARERRAALIGAAAGLGAIAATKATSAGTTGAAAKGLLQGAFAKWLVLTIGASALGIGVVLGVAGGDGRVPVGASRFAPALGERRLPAAAEPIPERAVETEAIVEVQVDPEPTPAAATPPARGKRAPRAPAPSASADRAARLAAELQALRVAREALASGDGARALGALDDYDARFPRGHLALEAEVLRIEALSRAGDVSAAARARRFLEAHPQSPYAERLRALAGEGASIP